MEWRFAGAADARALAELNQQLIADEGHDNPMDLRELEQRLCGWLSGEYRAVLFSTGADLVAYALYRNDEAGRIYLRQFFVVRSMRRRGIGSEALRVFRSAVVPSGKRIVLDVLSGNRAGREFWAANGFHEYAVIMQCVP
jgi:GNAT superfamily N-acetyltransferase